MSATKIVQSTKNENENLKYRGERETTKQNIMDYDYKPMITGINY